MRSDIIQRIIQSTTEYSANKLEELIAKTTVDKIYLQKALAYQGLSVNDKIHIFQTTEDSNEKLILTAFLIDDYPKEKELIKSVLNQNLDLMREVKLLCKLIG